MCGCVGVWVWGVPLHGMFALCMKGCISCFMYKMNMFRAACCDLYFVPVQGSVRNP